MNGLARINIEITNRCNKSCYFCAWQNPKLNPHAVRSDMDFVLLQHIAGEVAPGIDVYFHCDGEPLVYPRLREALELFGRHTTCILTNGKLLLERFDDIVDHCTTLVVSAFEKDPEGEEQARILAAFDSQKGDRSPQVWVKVVGGGDPPAAQLGIPVMERALHVPGRTRYRGAIPGVPEIGICLDLLHGLSVTVEGAVYACNRFSNRPWLGHLAAETLEQIWEGATRRRIYEHHCAGRRDRVPGCQGCQYWGVPVMA